MFQFECRSNELTSLDVSNNPNLVLLSLGDNPISQLDVTNNNILTILECAETQIYNLNLSQNNGLTSLICNDNNMLSYINLKNGNNENLDFSGFFPSSFENLPNLETICIDDIDNTALIVEITGQVGHQVDFTEDCMLGKEDINFNEVVLYPVPVKEKIHLIAMTPIVQVDVFDILGQKVFSVAQEAPILKVSLEKLPAGIYIIMLHDRNERLSIKKILKK